MLLPAFSPFYTIFSKGFFLRVIKAWDGLVKGYSVKPKTLFKPAVAFVVCVDREQTTQNVQSDLQSTKSTMLRKFLTKNPVIAITWILSLK